MPLIARGQPTWDKQQIGSAQIVGVTLSGEVAPISLRSFQTINLEPGGGAEMSITQFGCGSNPLKRTYGVEWAGACEFLGQEIDALATLANIVLGAGGQYGVPYEEDGIPFGDILLEMYEVEKPFSPENLVGFRFIRDVKRGNIGFTVNVTDPTNTSVPLTSQFAPYHVTRHVVGEAVCVDFDWQAWCGDGSRETFALDHMPLIIDDRAASSLVNPRLFYVEVQDENCHWQEVSNYTLVLTPVPAIVFSIAPPAGRRIKTAYIYDAVTGCEGAGAPCEGC